MAESKTPYDLVVIGAGPGGYVAAIRAAQLGWRVACIDREKASGGTCLRVGCIPSKALLESSQKYREARAGLAPFGIRVPEAVLDLPAMLKRKEQIVGTLTRGVDFLLKKNHVDRFVGTASLESPQRIVIAGPDAQTVEARHVLIATGSRSAPLKGVELDGHRIVTSTEALSFAEVPGTLAVIGAGFIGVELGSVWSRLGAKVVVLEYLDRILPGMDDELATEAKKVLEKQGLEFRLGTRVESARAEAGKCRVSVHGGAALEVDRVLLAVGRLPSTDGLNLEKAGVKTDPRGRVEVNEHFQTSVPGVFAIGDVIAGPMLAHKAEEEGIACVERLIRGAGHVDYGTIPGIVYTHPEIASVGATEEELKKSGLEYRKGSFPFRANGRAITLGETEGWVKILADARSDRVLGVHILGPHAGDLINAAALAISFGASSEDVARTCQAHPTLGEAWREAALAVEGRALHV